MGIKRLEHRLAHTVQQIRNASANADYRSHIYSEPLSECTRLRPYSQPQNICSYTELCYWR
jgi:hypothetical protein